MDAPSPAIGTARAVADELTRQLVLERRYAVMVKHRGNEPPALSQELKDLFAGFEARLCTYPDLESLLDYADRVLVRATGVAFDVALIRVVLDGRPLAERTPLEKLAELGAWLARVEASGQYSQMLVDFHVYEIHSRTPDAAWRDATRPYVRRGASRPYVSVGVTALDASTGAAWSNGPGLSRLSRARFLRRAYRERAMAPERRKRILGRTGFQPERAAIGAVAGGLMGIAATRWLLSEYIAKGDLYAGAAALSSAFGALIGVKLCRICRQTIAQAVAGGLASLAATLGYWRWRGMPIGPSALVLAGMVAFASFVVGWTSDPSRR